MFLDRNHIVIMSINSAREKAIYLLIFKYLKYDL